MNLSKKTKSRLITYGTLLPLMGILCYLLYTGAISKVVFWGVIIVWMILNAFIQYKLNPEQFQQAYDESKKTEENEMKVKVPPSWATIACDVIIALMYIASWVLVIHQGTLVSNLVSLLVLTFVLVVFVGLNYIPQKVEVIDGVANWKRLIVEMWRNRIVAFLFALAFFGVTIDGHSLLAKISLAAFVLILFFSGYFIRRIK